MPGRTMKDVEWLLSRTKPEFRKQLERAMVDAFFNMLVGEAARHAESKPRATNGTSKPVRASRKSSGKRQPLTAKAIEAVARKLTSTPQEASKLGDERAVKRLLAAGRAKRVGPDGTAWSKDKHGGRGVRWVKATAKKAKPAKAEATAN